MNIVSSNNFYIIPEYSTTVKQSTTPSTSATGMEGYSTNNDDSKMPKSIWRAYSEKTLIVHNEYVVSKILGKGSFGIVHQGFHKDTYEPVAIKLEHCGSKTRILSKEYQTYVQIYEEDAGLPRVLAFGQKDDFQYMVMQMLGPSLEELLRQHTAFSLKTVLMLADQMVERMRFMHQKGFLHRDIKPENFLMGLQQQQDVVHIIDLGLAKRWKLPNGGHIKYMTGGRIIGTARYASINSHIGNQLSRRDDMESLGYLLVYLAKGKLPWQNLRFKTKEEKYEQIMRKKQELPIEKLCAGLPKEFVLYFTHVRSLAFDEEPCYDYLKGLFLTAFSQTRQEFDFKWDWSC
jgi:serine/threonine protein kinase